MPSLPLISLFAKAHAAISRRMESRLSIHGIGLTDFLLLLQLAEAPGEKMRRVDLAQVMGITASGVTRILAPLEKIGLIGRESHQLDARVSFVVLTQAGRRLFQDAAVTATQAADDILAGVSAEKQRDMTDLFRLLSGLTA